MKELKNLYVVATLLEAKALWGKDFQMGLNSLGQNVVLITGVGCVNTLLSLSSIPLEVRPEKVVNLGIAGVYPILDTKLELTQVVQIKADRLGDLGATDGSGFIDFEKGWVQPKRQTTHNELKQVNSLTVNCCTGTIEESNNRMALGGEVESMEGVAVFRWAQERNLSVVQIRSLSNWATTRNKSSWKINESLKALKEWLENSN